MSMSRWYPRCYEGLCNTSILLSFIISQDCESTDPEVYGTGEDSVSPDEQAVSTVNNGRSKRLAAQNAREIVLVLNEDGNLNINPPHLSLLCYVTTHTLYSVVS